MRKSLKYIIAPLLLSASIVGCTPQKVLHSIPFTTEDTENGSYGANTGPHYALPKGLIKITVTRKKLVVTMGVALLNIPDPAFWYSISKSLSSGSHDKIVFSVDSNGLLTSVSSDNKDEAPLIAKRIAQIVAKGAELAGNITGGGLTFDDVARATPLGDFVLETILSAEDSEALRQFNTMLVAQGGNLSVSLNEFIGGESSATTVDYTPQAEDCNWSICARLPKPVFIGLNANGNSIGPSNANDSR